ncbi:MAG: transposase [Actinomycetota bacterium]
MIHDTLHEVPEDGSTQWTTRSMAKRFGIGKDSVARIWRDHELKPWRVEYFKISNDPHFEDKLVDVVGLYLDLPERAVVFSFDEKTQCQALDRTQPGLPMRAGTRGHAHPKRARWHLHFTPTSSSWLNLVEGWFKLLTERRLRHGVFSSVETLREAIELWAEHWNDDPKPFVWRKTAEEIIEKGAARTSSASPGPRHAAPLVPEPGGPSTCRRLHFGR